MVSFRLACSQTLYFLFRYRQARQYRNKNLGGFILALRPRSRCPLCLARARRRENNVYVQVILFPESSGAPNDNFRKISVRKMIWDLEFSEHLL